MHNQFQAVLFDLGNVVIKIHFERCFKHWAFVAGKNVNDVTKAFVFDEAYAQHEVAGITGLQYHAHVNKLLGMDIPYEEFVFGWNSIFGEVIPETTKLIQDLKPRCKIFGFTNSNLLHRPVWSEKYKETLASFDHIFCSSHIKLRKPNPEGFAKICAETGIEKERFIFIDDLPENILGGSKFGLSSILFSDPLESTNKVRSLVF